MTCKGCRKSDVKMSSEDVRRRSMALRKSVAAGEAMDRFQVFSMSKLKDFVVFTELMDEINVNVDDVKRFIEAEEGRLKDEFSEADKIMRHALAFMNMQPRCPDCNRVLEAIPVNTMRCNRIPGKYKNLIQCPNWQGCGYERAISTDLMEFMQSNRRNNIKNLRDYIDGGKES